MPFPASPLDLVVEISVSGEWLDITGYVLTESPVTIFRGRAEWGTDVDPGRCSLVLDNRGGRFSPRNPRSEFYGRLTRNTPIRVGVRHGSEILWRFAGEVSAWPSRWDLSQNMQWAPIEAAGVLRRLNASSTPLQSAYYRYIMAGSPFSYWPLTDAERTQNARAAVNGNIAYVNVRAGDFTSPMRWASFDIAPWLEPIAQTPEETTRGVFRGYVRGPGRPQSWSLDFLRAGVGGFDSMQMQCDSAGTNADPTLIWSLVFDHVEKTLAVSVQTTGDDSSSVGQVATPWSQPTAYDGSAHAFRLECSRATATSTRWAVYMDGVQLRTGTRNVAPRPPMRWLYDWWTPSDNLSTTVALGHVAVWDSGTAPSPSALMLAMHGHTHETAGARISRVAEEAGLAVSFVGDPALTQVVGPQGLMSPLECIREAAHTDGGILHESREDRSLVYRTSHSRYNRGHELESL